MGSIPITPIGKIQLVSRCIPRRNCAVDVAIVGGILTIIIRMELHEWPRVQSWIMTFRRCRVNCYTLSDVPFTHGDMVIHRRIKVNGGKFMTF